MRVEGVIGGGEFERSNEGRRSRGGELKRVEKGFWGDVIVGEEIERRR